MCAVLLPHKACLGHCAPRPPPHINMCATLPGVIRNQSHLVLPDTATHACMHVHAVYMHPCALAHPLLKQGTVLLLPLTSFGSSKALPRRAETPHTKKASSGRASRRGGAHASEQALQERERQRRPPGGATACFFLLTHEDPACCCVQPRGEPHECACMHEVGPPPRRDTFEAPHLHQCIHQQFTVQIELGHPRAHHARVPGGSSHQHHT